MADIRPNALPAAITPVRTGDALIIDQGADGVRQISPIEMANYTIPIASQSEAEAGTDNVDRMTSLRTKQSIASEVGVTIASVSQGNKADSAVQTVNSMIGPDVIIDKADIGLGDVDNTSDIDKPVSTATQSAIDSATAGLFPEFNTLADLQAATVPNEILAVSVIERDSGRGGGAVWKRSASEPAVPSRAKVQDSNNNWWMINRYNEYNPEMFGAYTSVEISSQTRTVYNAMTVKPSFNQLMAMDWLVRNLISWEIWELLDGLYLMSAAGQSDAVLNWKSPGTNNLTPSGSPTFTPWIGYTGDGVDAELTIPAPTGANNYKLNSGHIGVYARDEVSIDSAIFGNTAGSLSYIRTVRPTNELVFRLNSSTNLTVTDLGRTIGHYVSNRTSSTKTTGYKHGVVFGTSNAASVSLPTGNLSLLRNSSSYATNTVSAAHYGAGLPDWKVRCLYWLLEEYIRVCSNGSSSRPVSTSDFTPTFTPTQTYEGIQAAVDYALLTGSEVKIGGGMYVIGGGAIQFDTGSTIKGSGIGQSYIRLADTSNTDLNIFEPKRKDGSVTGWFISDMTLDGNRDRLPDPKTQDGTQRPGSSCIATMGASYGNIERVHCYKAVLHGIDVCNGGEYDDDAPTSRRYVSNKNRSIYYQPLNKSIRVRVEDCIAEHCGDDAFTTHFCDYVWFVNCIGRHAEYPLASLTAHNAFEADDGSQHVWFIDCEAFDVVRGYVAKCHDPYPPARQVHCIGCKARYVNIGFMAYDGNQSNPALNSANGIIVDGLIVENPVLWRQDPASDAICGIRMQGYIEFAISNCIFNGRGSNAEFAAALSTAEICGISMGSRTGLGTISNNFIRSWNPDNTNVAINRAAIGLTASVNDVTIVGNTIVDCGAAGIMYTGDGGTISANRLKLNSSISGSVGITTVSSIVKSGNSVAGYATSGA